MPMLLLLALPLPGTQRPFCHPYSSTALNNIRAPRQRLDPRAYEDFTEGVAVDVLQVWHRARHTDRRADHEYLLVHGGCFDEPFAACVCLNINRRHCQLIVACGL